MRTRTTTTSTSSQLANKAPNNTEGHKAKKARKTQATNGSLVNGRSSDISSKVRNSRQSPSTDDRSLSCSSSSSSSSSNDTQCGGDKPQEKVQPRNEDNTAKLIKKRRLGQSQEENQLDRTQEIHSLVDSPIVDSPTNSLTDPPRQRKKRRQHREDDDRIS
jgi:hypothetical protein